MIALINHFGINISVNTQTAQSIMNRREELSSKFIFYSKKYEL